MISKSADVFGRPETLLVSVVLYVLGKILYALVLFFEFTSLGTSLQANSRDSYSLFCAGSILWTVSI